ncbi:MAG: Hsp20/alpha crystallin family protein [Aristaeellaceae bacterium]
MYTIVPFRTRREMTNPFDDRFFRSFFDMNDMVGSAGFRVDVKEQQDAYTLEAELPGVKQEDIALTVDDDVLTIAADVNTQKKEQRQSYLYSERRTGHMERRFSLEGIRQEAIAAAYQDGVLTITLPKAQPEQPKAARRIAITGTSQGSEVPVQNEQH